MCFFSFALPSLLPSELLPSSGRARLEPTINAISSALNAATFFPLSSFFRIILRKETAFAADLGDTLPPTDSFLLFFFLSFLIFFTTSLFALFNDARTSEKCELVRSQLRCPANASIRSLLLPVSSVPSPKFAERLLTLTCCSKPSSFFPNPFPFQPIFSNIFNPNLFLSSAHALFCVSFFGILNAIPVHCKEAKERFICCSKSGNRTACLEMFSDSCRVV